MISQAEAIAAGWALSPGRLLFHVIPWYSLLIGTGILLALAVAGSEEKRHGLPKDTVVDAALWLIPAGILGARIYYVAFSWDQFAQDPWRIFRIWEGGLAIYGAVLGGLCALILFCRSRKLSVLDLTDTVIPGLLLAQAIGRWGNYFNREAFGIPILSPALHVFPMGVLIPSGSGYVWHTATFFYEFVWNICGFCLLMLLRKKLRHRGDMSLGYMLIYGSGRMVIEGLRTDSLMAGSTLRISQLLSLLLACAALAVPLIRIVRRWRGVSWIAAATGAAVSLGVNLLFPPTGNAFPGFSLSLGLLSMTMAGCCAGYLLHSPKSHLSVLTVTAWLPITWGIQILMHVLHTTSSTIHSLICTTLLGGWIVCTGGLLHFMSSSIDKEVPCL